MTIKTRPRLIWEVQKGKEKEIIADIINLSLNHEDWSDSKTLLVLLSIDKWYMRLPNNIKNIVDDGRLDDFDIVIQEVDGLPLQ